MGARAGTGSRAPAGDDIPFVSGTLAGVGAFLAGYVVTYLAKAGDQNLELIAFGADLVGIDLPATWKLVGIYFFRMHNVGTTVEGPIGGGLTITQGGDIGPVLLAMPIALLLAAGGVVAWLSGRREPVGGAVAGGSVALGYLPCSIALALFSKSAVTLEVTFRFGPDPIEATLLAGIAYPLVVGGIGGLVAGVLNQ